MIDITISDVLLYSVGIITVLGSVIALLWNNIDRYWKQSEKRFENTEKKLAICEDQHRSRDKDMLALAEKVGRLEGVQAFGAKVLNEVKRIKDAND